MRDLVAVFRGKRSAIFSLEIRRSSLKAMGDPFETGGSAGMGITEHRGPVGLGRRDRGGTIAASLLLIALLGFAAVLRDELEEGDPPALGACGSAELAFQGVVSTAHEA